MFEVIAPKDHKLNASKIERYWESFCDEHQNEDYQDCVQSITEECYYLVFEHKKDGIIGGAVLMPQGKVDDKNCYLLTGVALNLPDDSDLLKDENSSEFDALCESFYTGLVETLTKFAKENSIDAYIFENPDVEHEEIGHFGKIKFLDEELIQRGSQELVLGVYVPNSSNMMKELESEDE